MVKSMKLKPRALIWLCFLSLAVDASDEVCQHSYQFKINTKTKFDFHTSVITRHKFAGNLSLRMLSPSSNPLKPGTWWGIQLSSMSQKVNGESAPVESLYTVPFAVLREPAGKLTEFHFPEDWSKEQKDRLKGFAYYLQFSSAPIERTEHDTIGDYSARYSIQGDSVQKIKLSYLNSARVSHQKNEHPSQANAPDEQAFETIKIITSDQQVTKSSCWVESMRGEETLQFEGMGDAYRMETSQNYHILSRQQTVSVALWDLPLDHRQWYVKAEDKPLTEKELEALRAELIATLDSLDILKLRGSELGEFLKKYDQALDVILALMISQTFSDAELKRLFNALGQMDTVSSNTVLLNAISESALDEENRFRAMRAITQGTSALAPELGDQMLSLLLNQDFKGSPSLRGAAVMALGAVVQRRESNEVSDSLLMAIENQMTPEVNPNERAALAASLGNTGSERVLDTLSRFTKDKHDRVRANVATSLGQIAHQDSKHLLYDMLVSEEDNKPKQAAVHALRNFVLSPAEIDGVSRVARESKSERTRSYAIKTLSTQTNHPGQVKSALKSLMKTEPNKRNFVQAAKALTSLNQLATDPLKQNNTLYEKE